MTARLGRTILAVAGLIAWASHSSTALAQGNVFNPYGNSGLADYREFTTPMYSNNPALPGQARLDREPLVTRPRANSYQQYTDELNGTDTGSTGTRRGSSSNLPYYQAYQQLNSRYNRVYRPNDSPENRKYEERMRQRDAAYARALEERDPVKRAQMLRQLQQGSTSRSTTPARPGSTTTGTVPRSSAPAPGTRASSPYATVAPPPPGERRSTTAPPPYSGSATRRPSSTTPATRTPAPSSPTSPSPAGSGAPTTTTPRSSNPLGPPPDPSTIPIPAPR